MMTEQRQIHSDVMSQVANECVCHVVPSAAGHVRPEDTNSQVPTIQVQSATSTVTIPSTATTTMAAEKAT